MRRILEVAQYGDEILQASFSANPEATFKTAVRIAQQLLRAESCAIFRVLPEAPTQLELVASFTDKDKDRFTPVHVEIAARPGSGITGYAAHAGVPVNLSGRELRENPYFSGAPSRHLFGERDSALLVIPLKDRKGRLLGLLKAQNRRGADGSTDPEARFDAEDEAVARMLATKLVFALENLRVLQTFRKLMNDIRSRRTHANVFQKILECAMNVVAATRCDLALWDPKLNDLVLVAQTGPRAHTRNAGERVPNQGIIRRVWQNPRATYELVSNVTGLADYHMAHPSTRSELALRMDIDGRPIGVINAESFHLDWFDKYDVSILELLGQQAAVALQVVDAAGQVDELARQVYQDLEKPLHASLENVLRAMQSMFGFEHALIYISDEQRKLLDCVASMGVAFDHTGFAWRLDEAALATHVLRTMKGHFSPDPARDPLVNGAGIVRFGITSPMVAVPLVFRGRALGVLVAWSPLHRPTEDHIQLLEPLAQMAAWKIEVWRALEELREARASYQTLVDALPHAVLQKDKHGRFTFANRRFCESLGKGMAEIIGRQDADFYPAEMARQFRDDDDAVMRGREPLAREELNQPVDGEARWVKVIKVPLFDAQGEPCGIQAIFWDVSEDRKITAELQATIAELGGALEYKDRLLREIEARANPAAGDAGAEDGLGGRSHASGGSAPRTRGPTSVFVCYAHQDRKYCHEIVRHLLPLPGVAAFSDQDVLPGTPWHDAIQTALRESKVGLLLVSTDFLSSRYIREHEAPILLADGGGKVIIPVFVCRSSVDTIPYRFQATTGEPHSILLTTYQGVNSADKPLQGLSPSKRAAIYVALANRIWTLLNP